MSLYELNRVVGKAAKAIYDNEKFPTEVLAVRARKVAEAYPTDPTVVAMYNFLNKRASSEIFITRAELKDVYNRMYSQNNKFAGSFSEELGATIESPVQYLKRDPKEGHDLTKEVYELADPVLANALSSVLEKKDYRPYSAKVATAAARTCLHELNRFVQPKKIDVVAGRENVLLCQATYETPKGTTHLIVPVEVKDGNAFIPTVFLSQAGFRDISREGIEEHIINTAGKSYNVDLPKVLEVVSAAKNGTVEPLSEMELIIAKMKAANGTPSYTANGILYQEVDKEQLEVATPRSDEADLFATKLASTSGAAEFMFSKSTVDRSREIVRLAVSNFGFKHANIAVVGTDNNTIFFGVSIDNRGSFKVPVKVADGRIDYPKFVIASGNMYDFSSKGISSLLAEADADCQLMAMTSPSYGLKSAELIEQVSRAMQSGNLAMAEDGLAVLQASGDMLAFKTAFDIYTNSMSGKAIQAESKCTMQRKMAHSKYTICGHTNLPLHKVYQDQYGDCLPLYRKNCEEPAGASFMHSKVYFG